MKIRLIRLVLIAVVGLATIAAVRWYLQTVTSEHCITESVEQASINAYDPQDIFVVGPILPAFSTFGTTTLQFGPVVYGEHNYDRARGFIVTVWANFVDNTMQVGKSSTALVEGYTLQILSIEQCMLGTQRQSTIQYGLRRTQQ